MKKLFVILALLVTMRGFSQVVYTVPIKATIDWSSYGTWPYVLGAAEFCDYLDGITTNMNHFLYVGGSGQNTESQYEGLQAKRNLPMWAIGTGTNLDFYLNNDNGSYDYTTTTNWTIKLFNAPPFFWNGVDATNTGTLCPPVKHFAMGRIPANSAGGTSGNAIQGNQGSMDVAAIFGTPLVDTFHLLYTNGILTVDSDFYPFGHPKPPGSLAMTIRHIQALNYPTNIGWFFVDYLAQNSLTNHFSFKNLTFSSTQITGEVCSDYIPMGWDVPDGTVTNDARNCFVEDPTLGTAITWIFGFTNLPAGIWTLTVDGQVMFTGNETQWAVGFNAFTNYTGQYWKQRIAMRNARLDQYGADHVTLEQTHNAGSSGSIPGRGDLINYWSHADAFYTPGDLAGYTNAMYPSVFDMYAYDTNIYNVKIQTNHPFALTKQILSPAAPYGGLR
jgi:hypothetical protein